MSSLTVNTPGRPADSGGSGTRLPAFLRPLPGERRDGSGSDATSRGPGGDGRAGDALDRLFPRADASDASDASPGSVAGLRLGHFVVEERIGRGGMGGVFRAVDERLNRVVALKVLAPTYARDPAAAERFRNEAQAAARLDHENIARVYYVGEDQGVPFIAFEFVRGTNVRDFILQKGTLSPAEAVNYTLQIAQALRHTQAARVVHRDIKPSNIIITPSGHAKLVDLGLARQEQVEPARELTVPGTTLGTFDYIAPEQARDPRNVDVRTDIYSLGCTLYHMLTSEPPFPQGTMIQKVVDHHRDAPPDPVERNPLVPPQLSRIVRRMMASNPDERYSGPESLIHELAQVAAALGLHPTQGDNLIWVRPLYQPQPGFFEHNKGWLVTLAALLLIAAVIPQLSVIGKSGPGTGHSTPGEVAAKPEPGQGRAGDRPSSDPQIAVANRRGPAINWSIGASALSGAAATGGSAHNFSTAGEDRSTHVTGDMTNPATESAALSTRDVERNVEQLMRPVPGARAGEIEERRPPGTPANVPFVVIDPVENTEQTFATLEAACQYAPSEGLIELRFDGRLPAVQPPVRIQKKRLTIRAQHGRRPVLEFSATSSGLALAAYGFRITDGELHLQNVDLQLTVRSEHSVVFSLAETDVLRLQGVSLSVLNPDARSAAVVELTSSSNYDPLGMMPDSMHRDEVIIDWHDCLVRADSDVLWSESLDSTEMRCVNVAVAARGAWARIRGRTAPDGGVGEDRRLALRLRKVTACLYDGLLRIDTGSEYDREFLPLDVQCEESAIVVRPGQMLTSIAGVQDVMTLRRRLTMECSRSVFDVRGSAGEVMQTLGRQRAAIDFADMGIDSTRSVEMDLLEQPFAWGNPHYSAVDERAFRLRRSGSPGSRDPSVGAEFGGGMPETGERAADDSPRATEPRS
ncbi:MAG: serine/threonine-protein kinase [Planctomycetaceae bacterium]